MLPQIPNKNSKRIKQAALISIIALLIAAILPQSRERLIGVWMFSLRSIREISSPILTSSENRLAQEALREEVKRLRALSSDLVISRTELDQLRKENIELKDITGYKTSDGFKKIIAHNLGRPPESLRAVAVIDVGSEEGVLKGSAIVSPAGNLVGIVEDTRAHNSSVRLLFDARTKIAAKISGVSEANGIVMPIEGGALALRFLGENISVPKTSVITTTAIAGILPAGLAIGTIETTSKEEETPFLRAIVSSPERFDDLDFVTVLVP